MCFKNSCNSLLSSTENNQEGVFSSSVMYSPNIIKIIMQS